MSKIFGVLIALLCLSLASAQAGPGTTIEAFGGVYNDTADAPAAGVGITITVYYYDTLNNQHQVTKSITTDTRGNFDTAITVPSIDWTKSSTITVVPFDPSHWHDNGGGIGGSNPAVQAEPVSTLHISPVG